MCAAARDAMPVRVSGVAARFGAKPAACASARDSADAPRSMCSAAASAWAIRSISSSLPFPCPTTGRSAADVNVTTPKDSFYIRRVRAALTQSFAKDFKIEVHDQAGAFWSRPRGQRLQRRNVRVRFDRDPRHAGCAGAGGGLPARRKVSYSTMQAGKYRHHRTRQRRRGHADDPDGERRSYRGEARLPAARSRRVQPQFAEQACRVSARRSKRRTGARWWIDPDIHIVAELVGGTGVAREIIEAAIAQRKIRRHRE